MNVEKIVTNINNNLFWNKSIINSDNYLSSGKCIKLYTNSKQQKWLGFGGAFTEASCYNLNRISSNTSNEVIQKYFSKEGNNYNWIRLPIASTDFCLDSFQFTYEEDLSDFNINHDIKYIIPKIKEALAINPDIQIVASPWSPPEFMKDSNSLYRGKLNKRHYNLYAEYLCRFIIEYKNNDINIDYLTMQNEPFARVRWESCYFDLNEQRDFIYNYLIPKLKIYNLNTKILVWDHNKEQLFKVANKLVEDNEYIAGIAYHYYTGPHEKQVRLVREKYPDKLMIHTEGCCGFSKYDEKEWVRDAEIYIDDIVKDINNGGNAYIDWNIFLDNFGGPTYKNNYCKSPIVLDNSKYILSPIYFYIGHISKFFENGCDIVRVENNVKDIQACANVFKNKITITVANMRNNTKEVNIVTDNNVTIHDIINGHEIVTYIINI